MTFIQLRTLILFILFINVISIDQMCSDVQCFCNTCKDVNYCKGLVCYSTVKMLNGSISQVFGCVGEEDYDQCPEGHKKFPNDHSINSGYKCCQGSNWCNMESSYLSAKATVNLFSVEGIKIQNLGYYYYNKEALYIIYVPNYVFEYFSINVTSMNDNGTLNATTNWGFLEVAIKLNTLYKFEIVPMQNDEELINYGKTFYMKNIYEKNVLLLCRKCERKDICDRNTCQFEELTDDAMFIKL